jgi:hypothetical protein
MSSNEKKPEKMRITFRGMTKEIETPPSTIDPNHPLLNELQINLLRLRPGEQLKLPFGHFDALTTDPLELTIFFEVGIVNGCDVRADEIISEHPTVRGYVFTRREDVPLLEWIEPEGGKQ